MVDARECAAAGSSHAPEFIREAASPDPLEQVIYLTDSGTKITCWRVAWVEGGAAWRGARSRSSG